MSSSGPKQRLLQGVYDAPKHGLKIAEPQPRPVLEQFIYAVCREGLSRDRADTAFSRLKQQFIDWNEIRVASPREVWAALGELPDLPVRVARIQGFLNEIFESFYAFDLEALHKKGIKQAEKQLERCEGANEYIVASTLQSALGAHSLPIDSEMLRPLTRLELVDESMDSASVKSSLEHLVPKSRGPQFFEIISAVAHQYCHDQNPDCAICPLRRICPAAR